MVSTLPQDTIEVTCSAPVNIAVVKYWGKRDTQLLLPTNSSLSLTLSQDHLASKTTVRLSSLFDQDRLWLNGKEESISASKRLTNVIQEARRLRSAHEVQHPSLPKLSLLNMHIASMNNFPTAAGLASSASGFACLTYSLYKALELPVTIPELSRLARVGSGSACRSLFGGFVAWEMGQRADGLDSMAVQVAPETHWPDMEALILVVSDARKDTGSTEGMQCTVETSELLAERLRQVPKRMTDMSKAIMEKDFSAFAELTMRDSNQFHSVCLDTYPPVFYLNDVSKGIIRVLTAYNKICLEREGEVQAAYTFDAGPNAVIFVRKQHVSRLLGVLNHFFPPPVNVSSEYFGRAMEYMPTGQVQEDVQSILKEMNLPVYPDGSLCRLISTRVGDGPRLLASQFDPQVSLLNVDGTPKV